MKGRVRKVRADLGTLEVRVEELEARIRAIAGGEYITLNLDEVDIVAGWSAVVRASDPWLFKDVDVLALEVKIRQALDTEESDEVE